MADGKLAAKMYAKFVAGMGRVAGGDTPNWASLPIDQREIWLTIEDLARGELAPSTWSTSLETHDAAALAAAFAAIDHGGIVEMTKVLIESLGEYAVPLGEWLDDPDRFEHWKGTGGGEEWREEQSNLLASITLAYGYLSAMAATAHISIAELIERHRIEAAS